MTAKPLPADYRAALEGIAWYRHHDPGCLSIQGRDQAAFLQRQTTHDVRLLNGDRALPTILTSSNARILDVLYLLPGSEGNILALTLPGQGAATAAYFKKRIFFMDQVAVEDLSAAYTQIDLIGPCREDILQPMGFTRAPTADEILTAEWEGCLVYLLHNSAPLWPGWRLFFPAGISTTIDRVLEQVGATQLTDENYHLLHLEN
ncbi:MAG TPA: hypothetical protein VN363_02685, partial [Anaerolineales bacterium]|nr:hypothetical protein [Anaerolineales bacterium]